MYVRPILSFLRNKIIFGRASPSTLKSFPRIEFLIFRLEWPKNTNIQNPLFSDYGLGAPNLKFTLKNISTRWYLAGY